MERRLIAASDGFVVLTEKAREILFPLCDDFDPMGRPIETIPCCVDQKRFREAAGITKRQAKAQIGLQGRRVIAYTGGLDGWYLTEEIAAFLGTAHRQDPSTFSIILTQANPERLEAELRSWKVQPQDYLIDKVAPAEVPLYLRAADMALSLIKPSYSKRSSSPTKIAEYLASGVPVVCNTGVGDVDALIEAEDVGVLLDEFTPQAYETALEKITLLIEAEGIEERCRIAAKEYFDLVTVGGPRYRRLYERLSRGDSRPRQKVRAA
jgi:glycosyltransferase involved in cell wall biosynthesis